MADVPATNGTRPTVDHSENTSESSTQTTTAAPRASSKLTDEQRRVLIEDLMQRRHGGKVKMWDDRRYAMWLALTKLKHAFGIHTFIPTEFWDSAKGVVYFVGEACWICDERR